MGELVGREREMARLRLQLDRAVDGFGGVTLIRGEAGIGKTALARWAVESAALRDFHVLIGRGHPHGSLISYGPIVEALGRTLRELDDDDIVEITDRIFGLSVLLPGLIDEPELPSLPDDLALTRTLEAIRGLLVRLAATHPVLLVIDDVQWADASTLRTLTHVSGEVDGAPLVILLTMREGEDADRPDVRTTLAALRRVTAVDELTPARLDATETAAMLAALDGGVLSPVVVAEIVERSVGTPLFVEALGRDALDPRRAAANGVAAPPPAAVTDAISERLHGLSSSATTVLAAVALAATDADLSSTRRVSALDEDAFDAAVRELTERHLVATIERGHSVVLDIAHPVIAEVVDARLSPLERRRLHLALLDGLGTDVDAEIAAVHIVGAAELVDPDRALTVLGAAVDQALQRHAYRSVAAHGGRALDLARSVGRVEDQLVLAEQLSRALFGLGEIDAAEAITVEAAKLQPSDERLLLPVLMRAEVIAWLLGREGDELERFERVLDAVPPDDIGPNVLRALEHRMSLRARRKDFPEMKAAAADTRRRLAHREEPSARAMYLISMAYVRQIEGRSAEALRILDEVAEIARNADQPDQLHRVRLTTVDGRLVTGPVDAIRRAAAAVTGHTSAIYLSWRDPVIEYVCALASLDVGWLTDDEVPPFQPSAWANVPKWGDEVTQAHRAWLIGDVAGIDDLLLEMQSTRVSFAGEAERACVEGFVALLREDVGAARAALDGLAERPTHAAIELMMEELTARLALFVGDEEALARVLELMRRQDEGQGWASAHAERFDGAREVDDAAAAAKLIDAADRFAAVGDRRQEAESLTDAAERQPAALDRDRLATLLGPVTRAGLDRLAARMRAVLGEEVRHESSASTSLTTRQLEIAELVAEGLTNAAIADRLYISVRTVTSHLDHIYTRLGIANRTELAVRLPDLRT